MKTYIDYGEIIFQSEIGYISKSTDNRDYNIFIEKLNSGEAELIPYIPPAPTWEVIKAKRDQLLIESDWSGAVDAQPKPSKQAWFDYRQQLRDIPQNFQKPEDVIWPIKPE